MPNYYDFSKFDKIEKIEINPQGWVNPLTIEYSIGDQTGPTCFWRVKGTGHTFVIPVSRLNFLSSGDYAKHFSEVLEKFVSNDYGEWRKQGFSTPWMREYQNEYRNYVL